jgi:hypothetical protein
VRQSERANPSNLSTDSKFSDMLRTLSRKPFGVDSYDDADAMIDRLMEQGYWTVDNLTRVYQALGPRAFSRVPLVSLATSMSENVSA